MSQEYQMQPAEAGRELSAAPSTPAVPGFLQRVESPLAAIASNAATVEILTSLYIAQTMPRDEAKATYRMQLACQRQKLAEKAVYSYPRGGTAVTGPSIHLANALLGAWGNAEAGWKEVGRRVDRGARKGQVLTVSDCVAYCYDKETNTRAEVAFTVPHFRDKKNGQGVVLTDERDIYEICANMASRRMRACILRILPSWFVEEALDIVYKTREGDGKKPMADRIRNMVTQFADIGVSKARLEKYLGHAVEETVVDELRTLSGVLTSIRDGVVRASDFFEPEKAAGEKVAKAPSFAADPSDELPGLGGAGEMPSFGKEAYHD